MSAALALLLLTAAGVVVVRALDPSARGVFLAAMACLYGSGVVYAALLLLALLRVPWTGMLAGLGVAGIAAIAWVFRRRPQPDPPPAPALRWTWIDAVTAAVVSIYAVRATFTAPSHWDFWSIWGLKGKVFFEARSIDWKFLTGEWTSFAHPDYPLLLPLNFVWVSLPGGEWDERWLGVLYVAWAVALLLIVRWLAAAEAGSLEASAIALASAAFILQKQIGLAEVPLIAFGAAGVLFVRRGLSRASPVSLRHGAVLLGLAASTKNEGMALLVAVAVAMLIAGARRQVGSLWPALALTLPWLIVRIACGLPTDIASGSPLARLASRLGDLHHVAWALLRGLPAPWLWAAMAVGAVIAGRQLWEREKFTLLTMMLLCGFFVLSYLVTHLDAAWHIATSWLRLAPQLGVPLVFVVMLGVAPGIRSDVPRTTSETPR